MYIVTMKDEIYDAGHTGIDYYYSNKVFRISVLDKEWLIRNKETIDGLINGGN